MASAIGLNFATIATSVLVASAVILGSVAFVMRGTNLSAIRSGIPSAAAAALIFLIGSQAIFNYAHSTLNSLSTRQTKLWQDLWLPESQVTLSKDMGIPEYLMFSALAKEMPTKLTLLSQQAPK